MCNVLTVKCEVFEATQPMSTVLSSTSYKTDKIAFVTQFLSTLVFRCRSFPLGPTSGQTWRVIFSLEKPSKRLWEDLKRLMASYKILKSNAWIKEARLELRGVFHLVEQATDLRISNWNDSLSLSRSIGTRVAKVFGSHSSVKDRVFEIMSNPLLTFTGILFCIVIKDSDDWGTQLRRVFMIQAIQKFKVIRLERYDADKTEDDGATIERMRECLRLNITIVLDDAAKEAGAKLEMIDKICRLLNEAVDSFIVAITIRSSKPDPGKRTWQEEEYLKECCRSSKALEEAFAIDYLEAS